MMHRSYPWEPPSYEIPFDSAWRSAELRTLCGMAPTPENHLTFHTESLDAFGLPRVSGQITLSPSDREHLRACEAAHAELARAIEDPRHPTRARVKDQLPRGAPHLCGSHRRGDRPDGTTVTDPFGRVWAYENLYLAGNGMLPGSSSCNPALTVVAVALRTADTIISAYD
jgi:choline dehydrogenase-like flavoprotein